MKWIPLVAWLLFISPKLPAAEQSNNNIEQGQNSYSAEEESPWPKKNPPLTLEETELGQALENTDLTAYREAMSNLRKKSFEEASKILTATDKNGNNILHRIAHIGKDGFLAEAQSLAITLFHLEETEILNKILNTGNRENRTPKEISWDAKNQIAVEYFSEMENLIKLWKNIQSADTGLKPVSLSNPMDQEEIENMLVKDKNHSIKKEHFKVLLAQEMILKKGLLGAILLLSGGMLTYSGLETGYIFPILFGAPQMWIGGTACYEAFKVFELFEKHNFLPKD